MPQPLSLNPLWMNFFRLLALPAALAVLLAPPLWSQTPARSSSAGSQAGAQTVAAASSSPAPAQAPAAEAPKTTAPAGGMGQVLSSAENDYILTPGDVIEITIFREPDLTTRSAIARDGTVQLPLIQEVKLGGVSVREAREKLRQLYAGGFLVNPQVYLNVTQFAVRKFTIMGQVARPGSYLLEGGQTIELLEAVGMAGGFTRIADRGRVIVKRRVNGEIETFKVNARRMADGKIEPLMILPGDIITVGESWF